MNKKSLKAGPNSSAVWIAIGIVIVLAVGGLLLLQSRNQTSQTVETITPSQAAARQSAGAFILDVRGEEEWNSFHIPGSTLIPLNELKSRLNEVPRDRQVIVVCASGRRSLEGARILKQAGYANVTSLAGGLQAWDRAGLPLTTGP